MRAHLIVDYGGSKRAIHVLEAPVTTLGRGETNDIVTEHPSASRRHAQLRLDGTDYVLEDLGSANGTFRNGARIGGPQRLEHGDTISLPGLSALFRLTDETFRETPSAGTWARIRVDPRTAEVWVDEQPVAVTAKEFLALRALIDRYGGLISKDDLARAVWPEYQGAVGDYNIEQLVSRLRRKLEPDPQHPQMLLTVRGLGYRLLCTS